MDEFERELARALEPEEPPAGFSGAVLARIRGEQRTTPTTPTWRLAFAAVLVMSAFIGAFQFDHAQQREREQGEAAKQQVMLALRIAGSKVQMAEKQIEQFSARSGRQE